MTGNSRLIDITLPFSERLPVWPGDAPVQILRSTGIVTISELRMSSHVGTHLDAPAHFFPESWTVDQIPLETLVGPAWVADVGPASLITADILDRAAVPAGVERLLLKTRNSASANGLIDSSSGGRPPAFDEDYVGLDGSAGSWLLSHHVQLVGIDSPSADVFSSEDFAVHRMLLSNHIIIVENLDLQDVSAGRYRLICLPLRYEGGDGAPVRAVLEVIE